MRRFFSVLLISAMVAGGLGFSHAHAQSKETTMISLEARAKKLARGVNLFLQVREENGALLGLDDPHNHFTAQDVSILKDEGITHVGLAVPSGIFWKDGVFSIATWNSKASGQLRREIHRIIRLLIDADIAVVLKVMPSEEDMQTLYLSPEAQQALWVAFYTEWAKEFSPYPDEYLYFHTINEPRNTLFLAQERTIPVNADSRYPRDLIQGANRLWVVFEERLIRAIRTVAPTHTILVSGEAFAAPEGLLEREPTKTDTNVIYNFHYYMPLIFTHQSAQWVNLPGSHIRGLRYPVDVDNCEQLLKTAPNESRPYLERYCTGAWTFERHLAEMKAVSDWAKRHRVYVWLGEFGAYPGGTDEASVASYVHDIRKAAELNGIGWCVWEYGNWLEKLAKKPIRGALKPSS